MKHWGYKFIAMALVLFGTYQGLLMDVPQKPILEESIRNLFFHVPMWFVMVVLFSLSFYYSIKFLRTGKTQYDTIHTCFIEVGLFFAFLGIITGSIWAKYTWGEAWSNDPKQNSAAIATLIYLSNLILRNAIEDKDKMRRTSALYTIFSYPLMIALIYILPRLTDSLHPGNGGNPAFNYYDLDDRLRVIFYPTVLGWILLSIWITTISRKIKELYINQ